MGNDYTITLKKLTRKDAVKLASYYWFKHNFDSGWWSPIGTNINSKEVDKQLTELGYDADPDKVDEITQSRRYSRFYCIACGEIVDEAYDVPFSEHYICESCLPNAIKEYEDE